MTHISDIFNVITAKSKSIEDYSSGSIPFVSNGFYNNGIIGHVDPFETDRVIQTLSISVSAFCEATVQEPPFIGRGNGGSGMTILIPKDESMSYNTLLGYAALINTNVRWRYSYGRMVTKGRISIELIQEYSINEDISLNHLKEMLPIKSNKSVIQDDLKLHSFPIVDLFTLQHGDFHSLTALDSGDYPTVSRIDKNCGIVGYYEKTPEANIYPKKTITVSTVTGDSFVQLDPFISTDNVVLLTPTVQLEVTSLFYISMMINKEKWRWMYGRQCYKSKFSTTKVQLPTYDYVELNQDLINRIVTQQWGWDMIDEYLKRS